MPQTMDTKARQKLTYLESKSCEDDSKACSLDKPLRSNPSSNQFTPVEFFNKPAESESSKRYGA